MFTYQIKKVCFPGLYENRLFQILLVGVIIGTTSMKNNGNICPNFQFITFWPNNQVQNDSVQFILEVFK